MFLSSNLGVQHCELGRIMVGLGILLRLFY
uniref:Uncharacterized protein n=1 Tax=Rhizophora mucronata TaxID=61149 RepID=A0A2P2PLB4_RHIMU